MTNTEKLLELIKDNPSLPIVPMVDGEIPRDAEAIVSEDSFETTDGTANIIEGAPPS